jgi:hypothetical protein
VAWIRSPRRSETPRREIMRNLHDFIFKKMSDQLTFEAFCADTRRIA